MIIFWGPADGDVMYGHWAFQWAGGGGLGFQPDRRYGTGLATNVRTGSGRAPN